MHRSWTRRRFVGGICGLGASTIGRVPLEAVAPTGTAADDWAVAFDAGRDEHATAAVPTTDGDGLVAAGYTRGCDESAGLLLGVTGDGTERWRRELSDVPQT